MMDDKSRGSFWKERKLLKKDDTRSWLITKSSHGERIFDPEKNKENMAQYYENLYKKQHYAHHSYHDKVAEGVEVLRCDL